MFTSDFFKPGSKVNLYFRDDDVHHSVTLLSIDSYGITINSYGDVLFYTFNYVDKMKLVGGAK